MVEQLATVELSRFIHDDDRAFLQVAALQTFSDRLCLGQSIASKVDDLLSLRCDYDARLPAFEDRFLYGPKHETLSGARASAKKRNETPRFQNGDQRAVLVFSERLSVVQWMGSAVVLAGVAVLAAPKRDSAKAGRLNGSR